MGDRDYGDSIGCGLREETDVRGLGPQKGRRCGGKKSRGREDWGVAGSRGTHQRGESGAGRMVEAGRKRTVGAASGRKLQRAAARLLGTGRALAWWTPQAGAARSGPSDGPEDLDGLHLAPPALRTQRDVHAAEAQESLPCVLRLGLLKLSTEAQKMPADGQVGGLGAVGQKTEVADAHEARGQHVEEETPDELLGAEGAFPEDVAGGAITVSEGDLPAGHLSQAVVGDGHPVGVAGQVVEDLLAAGIRRLDVDHPLGAVEGADEGLPLAGDTEVRELRGEGKLPGTECAAKPVEEFATEHLREGGDGEEEIFPGQGEPFFFARRERPAGDHAVEVDVGSELLVPGVKQSDETDLASESIVRIFPEGLQRLAGGTEKKVIDGFLIVHHLGDGVQLVWEGENHVEIGHGQQLGPASLHPAGAGHGLALGAVAVAAGVVVDALESAPIALLDMAAHLGCAALLYVAHHPVVLQGEAVAAAVGLSVEAKDIGHLRPGWGTGGRAGTGGTGRGRGRSRRAGAGGGHGRFLRARLWGGLVLRA